MTSAPLAGGKFTGGSTVASSRCTNWSRTVPTKEVGQNPQPSASQTYDLVHHHPSCDGRGRRHCHCSRPVPLDPGAPTSPRRSRPSTSPPRCPTRCLLDAARSAASRHDARRAGRAGLTVGKRCARRGRRDERRPTRRRRWASAATTSCRRARPAHERARSLPCGAGRAGRSSTRRHRGVSPRPGRPPGRCRCWPLGAEAADRSPPG